MTPGDVVGRLNELMPFEHEAIGLYRRVRGGESAMSLYGEIEEAVRELEQDVVRNTGTVQRCMNLRPRPARVTPIGF